MMEPTADSPSASPSRAVSYSPSPSSPSALLRSDLEDEADAQQKQRNAVQSALDQLGSLLSRADGALENLEDQDVLGSAIVRGCTELADAIGNIANHIEEQSDEDRRTLAQACIDDAGAGLQLIEEEQNNYLNTEAVLEGTSLLQNPSHSSNKNEPNNNNNNNNNKDELLQAREELSSMSQDDVVSAIQAAGTLLRDIEATLRAIDQDEADEIADVALTVAHLFVASLQSVQESVTPDDILNAAPSETTMIPSSSSSSSNKCSTTTPQIEILDDEEEDDRKSGLDEERNGPNNNKKEDEKAAASKSGKLRRMDRVRVLWPPLGPAVGEALQCGKNNALQKPILAVALGITLWPAAVLTAVIGLPVVVMDGFAQSLYNNSQDTPIVECLERSAAQIYHTGRLSLLCGKLMGKQTLRVVKRQVQRHGGIEKIAHDVGCIALDRVTHPVETFSMAWDGIAWGVNMARNAYENMSDQERDDAALNLQQ